MRWLGMSTMLAALPLVATAQPPFDSDGPRPELFRLGTDDIIVSHLVRVGDELPRGPFTRATLTFHRYDHLPRWNVVEAIPKLRSYAGLHTVTLSDVPPGTTAWKELAALPALKRVELNASGWRDSRLPSPPPDDGEMLDVRFDALHAAIPAALAHPGPAGLGHLTALEELTLTGMPLTPELARVLEKLPKLRSLTLRWHPLSAESARAAGRLPHLCRLHVSGFEDRNALTELVKLRNLTSLTVDRFGIVTVEEVVEGIDRSPKIKSIVTSDEMVRALCAIDGLEEFAGGGVSEAAIPEIKRLKKLRSLKIVECDWSYAATQELRAAMKLPEWFSEPEPGRSFVVVRLFPLAEAFRSILPPAADESPLRRLMRERFNVALIQLRGRLTEFDVGKGSPKSLYEALQQPTFRTIRSAFSYDFAGASSSHASP